ncbi:MAG: VWA domain-containing protein [Marinicaulis sp.]|nr:VWA domain-containing protein [Marinicaulis sp.]
MIEAVIKAFKHSRDGNVAMMFGLVIFVLLAGAGAAVDFQRVGSMKADLQESADAALIAAVRKKMADPQMTDAEFNQLARRFFDANLENDDSVTISDFNIRWDAEKSAYILDYNANIKSLLMAPTEKGSFDIGIATEAKLGKPPFLEIVMALDNTGSMNSNQKLKNLKVAAKGLTETLLSHVNAEVKIGLVPFAQYVSVGADKEGAAWLDAPTQGNAFKGCVGSRAYPANTIDSDYLNNQIPGLNGAPCPNDILAMTDQEDDIKAAIDAMKGAGWTYIPAGLAWGWRAISDGEPFDQGESNAYIAQRNGMKALIVLTDGKNTKSPDYPTHKNSNIIDANQLTRELCDGIKADKIVVYSIAFDITDPLVRQLLEDCATTPGHYFKAENAADLNGAFVSIATSIQGIVLSK